MTFGTNGRRSPGPGFRLRAMAMPSLLLAAATVAAAPSGGPYGPLRQTWELPQTDGAIYYVAPDGSDDASGLGPDEPTTIEVAIARVVTGDAIVLRGGVYRTGDLRLNQGIVMQPYRDEQPVLKGTLVADAWKKVDGDIGYPDLWAIEWTRLFPSRPADWWRFEREARITPLHKFNNDMVFVDGRYLHSTGWPGELDDNSFYIDYERKVVYLAFDPGGREIEITAYNQGLVVTPDEANGKTADGIGPTIRGITFTQYAFHAVDVEGYFPEGISPESGHGKSVVGTTFEHCTISYGGRVGAFLLGDKLTMRHCKVSDTSTEGVYILASNDVLLEKNIFTRNNIEQITGYYPAAVKIFNQSHRVVCNDNLVIDHPDSNGIWYDVGNVDAVFTNNWLQNIGRMETPFDSATIWPSQNAFFFEISKGARVEGNVFVDNDHGVLVLNSSDAKVRNNTFVNSAAVFARDMRGANPDHFGWHPTTGPGVQQRTGHEFANNLLVGEDGFEHPLLYLYQRPEMCGEMDAPSMTVLDRNAYVRTGPSDAPVIWVSEQIGRQCDSGYASSAELHGRHRRYEAEGVTLPDYAGPLFRSPELGHYDLADGFPAIGVGPR